MLGYRSFAVLRARAPGQRRVAERFIRTLKENLLWAKTFDTIEELRAALVAFARHYNERGSSPATSPGTSRSKPA